MNPTVPIRHRFKVTPDAMMISISSTTARLGAPRAFTSWLDKYVYGVKNHREFLDLLSRDRRESLKPQGELFAPAVSFNY